MNNPDSRNAGPIIIAGATSTHGWALARAQGVTRRIPVCNTHAAGAFCRDWARVDAEDTAGWTELMEREQPSALIYCAGVCHVEQCEKHPAWARRINVDAVSRLLERVPACVRLVYLSSDHVFAGRERPYRESDTPDPVSRYGRLRVETEQRVLAARPDALIIRPGLCVGPSPSGRKGHWDSLAHRLSRGRPVTVIAGEYRTAVWSDDAAQRIVKWTESGRSGIRHLTATRPTERPELAAAICAARQLPARYMIQDRTECDQPHLGKVELASAYDDAPLTAVPDRLARVTPRQGAPRYACSTIR